LQNILNAKEIINGTNKISINGGFKQHITSKHYDINYIVQGKKTSFIDKYNHIKIQIIKQ
jgi:hypothetical protein